MNTNSLLSAFRLFRVKREERPLATVMLLVFLALDALVICKYYDVFTPQTTYYWHLFISKFHITKFTGTQMQNIGIGAHCFGTPSHRNRLSVSICST